MSNIKLLLFLVAASCSATFAQQSVTLNGTWHLSVPDSLGVAPMQVTVPNTFNVIDGLEDYAGKATYSRTFVVPEEMKGQLPDLAPGNSHDVVLKNVNKEYKFKVTRADGSSVLDY